VKILEESRGPHGAGLKLLGSRRLNSLGALHISRWSLEIVVTILALSMMFVPLHSSHDRS